MDEIWFFVVADDRERPIKHATCEYMGIYAELMNLLCVEHFGHDWMTFTTFTQKDYVFELHEEAGIDVKELPVMRQRFEPARGLEALLKIREFLLENEAEFIANEVLTENDFGGLITDFNTAMACLEFGQAQNQKWFLDVTLESAG